MQRSKFRQVLAVLVCAFSHAAVGEDYWNYAYKDFDVTTVGSSDSAVSVAHNIARFDNALARILELPEAHLRTHIYELPGAEKQQLLGDGHEASFRFSEYEVTVIAHSTADSSSRYWGALFGYTGSLLVNGRARRCPYWYKIGVPLVFASTQFGVDQITTGRKNLTAARALNRGTFIPMRTLLALQRDDPRLQVTQYREMFEAESWYLAHVILLEKKFGPEFVRYLGSIREGKSEADAFAASFRIGYDELDKFLIQSMREPVRVYVVQVPQEPPDHGTPRLLSAAEFKARLADLNLQWQHRADALRLAADALQADPQNETALSVIARANLRDGQFEAALAAVNKLATLSLPSAAMLTDTGDVLSQLARAVSKNQVSLAVDTDGLMHRAREAYERAMNLDAEYLRSLGGSGLSLRCTAGRGGGQGLGASGAAGDGEASL